MDLSQSFSVSALTVFRFLSGVGLSLLLSGCAANSAQQSGETVNATPTAEITQKQDTKPEDKTYLPLSPELVYYVLTAEIAGQRGEMGIAVDLYHRAAELVESPELASRSAQVATYSRDQQRIYRALERWSEVAPNDADIYILRAPFLMMQEDFDGVVKAVDKAVSLAPEKAPNYLARLSESLTELATPEQGMQIFEQLQCLEQDKTFAKFAYARLAAFYQFFDKAITQLDDLQQLEPENEEYLVLRADILQRTNRTEEALALIAKAAKKSNASHDLRFSYGKLLGESGKNQEARDVFESLNVETPQNKEVLYALGLLALEDNEPKQAKAYFSELLKLGDPTHQTEYFMGLAEEKLGNVDAALVWFASVPMKSHRFDMAQTRYINLLAERGEIDKARDHLALLRKEHPHQAVQYFLFESGFLRERGLEQDALTLLTQAIEKQPDNNELLYGRAMVAESLDRLDIVEADLRNIIEREPNNAQALNALGYTLTDRTDRHQEALSLIEKALEIKPNDPFYLDSLGWVYFRLGEYQKASRYLEQAIAIQPDVEFIAHLGEVLWVQGKNEEAMKIWRQGLKQDAENRLLLDTMQRYGQ